MVAILNPNTGQTINPGGAIPQNILSILRGTGAGTPQNPFGSLPPNTITGLNTFINGGNNNPFGILGQTPPLFNISQPNVPIPSSLRPLLNGVSSSVAPNVASGGLLGTSPLLGTSSLLLKKLNGLS